MTHSVRAKSGNIIELRFDWQSKTQVYIVSKTKNSGKYYIGLVNITNGNSWNDFDEYEPIINYIHTFEFAENLVDDVKVFDNLDEYLKYKLS